MVTIDPSEIQLVTNIIYRMHLENENESKCRLFMEQIKLLIPCDSATVYMSSTNDINSLDIAYGNVLSDSEISGYAEEFHICDYTNWMFLDSKTAVYRETDFFTDEIREKTEYYQKIYAPHGLHYSVQITLYHSNRFLGVLTLFRTKESGDFTDKEIFLLNCLKDNLALSLHDNSACPAAYADISTNISPSSLGLSLREFEIFLLVTEGRTNDEISEKLYISNFTVKKHLTNIYRKLNVHNRSELLLYFQELSKS